MTDVSSLSDAVTALASTFTGQLLRPGDAGYDEARKVHNGLIDKRPALIARCRGLADIADAVKMARDRKLEVAVRGGGHNVAGRATIDGGLMIDLSLMKGIHVDPKARTARAQGGLTWNEFNRETQLHGLATTGGVVSTTGIAGLTLGGGLGWLMGKHALALDSLLSVDLVLADGRILTASKDDNADLFWALRGGGGNFGVAPSFAYRLPPTGPIVTGGLSGCKRYSKEAATPKLPPPPRSAQNRSALSSLLAVRILPSARTRSTERRLSRARACLPMSQPRPPPSVRPAMPVVETTPPVVARPWSCVSRLNSFHVRPPCARAVRAFGST